MTRNEMFEHLQDRDVSQEALNYIKALEKENKELYIDKMHNYYYAHTYGLRNEKAIEYIKSLCYIESKNEWFTYGDDLSPEHIVNILQGEDKDE